MFDQFSATRTGLQDPNIRHTSHKKDRHGEYDGADGFWLQDEDTLEEGFLAAEDETVFWTIDDNEAFIARSYRGKGRANQAEHEPTDPSYYGAKAKGKGKDAAKSASSQGDPSPQAYEGTDPSAHHEAVYNSSESYMPSTQNSGHGPGVDTASAVFPLQHTVLSALTERINLDKSPTYVILDSGCTRAMGSRYAVNRLIKAVERYAPGKIEFSFSPSNTKFSFADSETALIKERVTLSIEVLDQGKVPILFSIEQMRNLHMTLECSPTADLATCAAFGLYKTPLPVRIVEEEPVPEDPVELYKLHLKHRHMNLDQFKRRTTALQIPKETYELYDQLVKKCSTCQEHKRAPSRAKISGLRSDTFGDLTFVDHGELPIPGKNNRLVFLILYDGATNLLTSEVVQDKEEHTTMSVMNDYFEKYQINPKVVVGDQAFMTPQMEA
ncbi:unnamed protein product [Symbiodinium sp. KB8]|nr:unnamed protein product [Symbiodinium sp. KB8]